MNHTFSKEFIDAVAEVHRLHRMKLVWLVPPVKSLSVGQVYRPVPNKKVTISGFNTTHFKKAPWNINPNNENQAGEKLYRIEVNLISPMEYLRLPSHLAEMARVDKIVALCKGKRDDINGVDGAFTSGSGNHLVLKDSVSRPGEPEVDTARTFVGCWSNRDRWSPGLNAEYWDLWMRATDKVMDYYIDGSTIDYADGLRANGYWNWPIKFNVITGKMYYNPKINPRSTNEVEAIITDLVNGKIMDEGEYNMGIPGAGRMPALSGVPGLVDDQSWRPTLERPTLETKPSPGVKAEPLPMVVPSKNPNKGIAKPRVRPIVNRNKVVPIAKPKKKE